MAGRRPLFWLFAFGVLFLAYHLPELAARRGVPQGIASAALLLFFAIAAWVARLGKRDPLEAYGLEPRDDWWAWLAVLFLLALVVKCLAVAVGVKWGVYHSRGPVDRPPGGLAWVSMLVVTLVPALAEDILTRGVFVDSPLARRGLVFVLATAAVYVVNHVWRLALGWREWLMLFCFGVAYGLAFWRTGTLWAALGLHWGWTFAGQAVDAMWRLDVLAADRARLLSAATHLVLAACVLRATDAMHRAKARPV